MPSAKRTVSCAHHAPFTEMVIQALSRCKVIARYGTGLDNISLEAAEAAEIPVEGVHDYCTQEVADHTLALLLAWNRKILHCHQFVWEKRWNERKQTTGNWGCQPLFRLSGQTLGVLGLGPYRTCGGPESKGLRDDGARLYASSKPPTGGANRL